MCLQACYHPGRRELRKQRFSLLTCSPVLLGFARALRPLGGECVFTSEWNKYSVRTYKANHYSDPERHIFNEDILEVTLSETYPDTNESIVVYIDQHVPDHDVLLAGFPCQPFSLGGVSKKNALGRLTVLYYKDSE